MIRTVVFFAAFWLSAITITPLGIIFLVFRYVGLEKVSDLCIHALLGFWAKAMMAIAGVSTTLKGFDAIPRGGRLCFVANHQGDMDVLALIAWLPVTTGFIAKKQALYFPVVNIWLVIMRAVFIDRGNIRHARGAIEKGAAYLRKDHPMVIFPEGTRSRGPRMGSFKPGSFKLATYADAVIVPVTIDGTWRNWEERMRIVPGRITLTAHEAIRTEGMSKDEQKELCEKVSGIIRSGLGAVC